MSANDASVEKQPYELWITYLARRLEKEGIFLTPFFHDHGEEPCYVRFYKHGADVLSGFLNLVNELTPAIQRLEDLVSLQNVYVGTEEWGDGPYSCIGFHFHHRGDCFVDFDGERPQDFFPELDDGGRYSPEDVTEKIVAYAKRNFKGKPNQAVVPTQEDRNREKRDKSEYRQPVKKAQEPLILEQILTTVQRLERLASEHPMALKPDHVYLGELYLRAINDNADNLRSFTFEEKKIPYVLVNSADLNRTLGEIPTPGRVYKNLFFVARDLAPQEWQQQIIAYHESLCVKVGHREAKQNEIKLANALGKIDEYREWIKSLARD